MHEKLRLVAGMTKRFFAVAVLAFALSLDPQPASAQIGESPDALIDQGVAARRAGEDDRALALFTRAWQSDHSNRSRAQMALAEQALGMWRLADAHLREALDARGDGWIESHEPALRASLDQIGEHLGTVEIRCVIVGAEVRIDGEVMGRTPLTEPLRVAAGTSTIEVTASGFLPLTREVTVVAGQQARETFELHARSASSLVVQPAASANSGGSVVDEWWFWTILGVVVVGAGVGIGVGVATGSTSTTQDPLTPGSGVVIVTLGSP